MVTLQMEFIFFFFVTFLFLLPIYQCEDDKNAKDDYDKNAEKDELILVQALWRHGDRTPIGTFETDLYQESHWKQGFGELTPVGMKQHVQLGKKLQKWYIEKNGFISEEYRNQEIYVRSTDKNRTLISAISNLIGFYGKSKSGDGYPKDLGPSDWPGWFVPIAVHTRDSEEDYVDRPPCPRNVELQELVKRAPEYGPTMAKYKPYLDFINEKSKLAGTKKELNLFNAWWIWDLFFVEKTVNGLPLVDWAEGNKTLLNAIEEMNNIQQQWFSGLGLSPVDGIDFVAESAKLHGGPLLWILIDNMRNKLACHQMENAVKPEDREFKDKSSPVGTPLCKWINRMRYFVYSAHDVTIASLFSAFGFNKTDNDRDGYPQYSACITLELWRDGKSGQFKVKVLYWRPEAAEPKEITFDISGCAGGHANDGCKLDQFIERSKPYQMLPTPKEYCQKPLAQKSSNSAGSLLTSATSTFIWTLCLSIIATIYFSYAH